MREEGTQYQNLMTAVLAGNDRQDQGIVTGDFSTVSESNQWCVRERKEKIPSSREKKRKGTTVTKPGNRRESLIRPQKHLFRYGLAGQFSI